MSISFKKYAEFVDSSDELSDEQITEIFGLFKNNSKVEKLKADREKLKAETEKKMAAWREKKELATAQSARVQPKNIQFAPRSAAAAGRAAEKDWTSNMATESVYSEINE